MSTLTTKHVTRRLVEKRYWSHARQRHGGRCRMTKRVPEAPTPQPQLELGLAAMPRPRRRRGPGRPRRHRPGETPHKRRARIKRHEPVHVTLRVTALAREL